MKEVMTMSFMLGGVRISFTLTLECPWQHVRIIGSDLCSEAWQIYLTHSANACGLLEAADRTCHFHHCILFTRL